MAFAYAHYLPIEIEETDERRRAQRELRLFRRNLRDVQDPFSLTDSEFLRNYRLSRVACADFIDQFTLGANQQRLIKHIPSQIMV